MTSGDAKKLIKGKVCGMQAETIEDRLLQKVSLPDKLAKGRKSEKVLR